MDKIGRIAIQRESRLQGRDLLMVGWPANYLRDFLLGDEKMVGFTFSDLLDIRAYLNATIQKPCDLWPLKKSL